MSVEEIVTLLPALRTGDPSVTRRFVDAYHLKLTAVMRRRFPILPREAVMDGATDALLDLFQHSERYDPQRGSLLNYLIHIAHHKLLDEIRKLKRRKENYVGGIVELALVEANTYREGDYPELEWYDPDVLTADTQELIEEILPDEADRRALALVLEGRSDTMQLAFIWKLDHLAPDIRTTHVKQNRDRILKKIQRRRQEFRRLLYGEIEPASL